MSSYSLRIPDDLMEDAKRLAKQNHTSLNQFFLAIIAEKIGEAKTKQYFESRARFADVNAVQAILERVPDAPVDDHR